MQDSWKKIDGLWKNSRVVAYLLVITMAGLVAWAMEVPKSPGVSVGLLALAAGIMSIRPDMHPPEKLAWLVFLIAFAVLEVMAIGRADLENIRQHAEQEQKFIELRQSEDRDFASTEARLESAIVAINSTLETANSTLLQTRPRAIFGVPKFELGTQKIGSGYGAGKPFTYNAHIENVGNDDARNVKFFSAMYIGKPNDLTTQAKLNDVFEKQFSVGKNARAPSDIPVGSTVFDSFTSPTLSASDVDEMDAGSLTFYIFNRIEFSDNTGHWFSDRCEYLVVPFQAAGIANRQCAAKYNNVRYRHR